MSFRHPVLVVVCLLFLLDYLSEAHNSSYLLTLPAELHGGTTEKFCLSTFGIREDVNIIFVVHNEDNTWNFNKRDTYVKGECRCTNIEVPEVYVEGYYIMTVWGFKEDQSLIFSKTIDDLKIVNKNTLTFIQTDKYMYIPGQTVKFRIVTTNINLMSKPGLISEVAVLNPNGIKMKKWADIFNQKGLLSFKFQIAPQPVLGKWKIKVIDGSKFTDFEFEVQKYVLPKFEVSIEGPSYLLVNTKKFDVKVCSHYSQGKEIQGQMESKICIRTTDEKDKRPCATYHAEICGCNNFSVNTSEVGLSLNKYSLKDAFLEITASVTDVETKMVVNSTVYGPEIKNEYVKIDLQFSQGYFKPGFPYYGKVLVSKPDNSIAAGEVIEVTAVDYVNDIELSGIFTSNEKGEIYFTIDHFDKYTEEFVLQARSINGTFVNEDSHHYMYTPIDTFTVKQWFSRTGKYLQIKPLEKNLRCNSKLNLDILYTATLRERINLYYLVMSKSQIVANGQIAFRADHRYVYRKENFNNSLKITADPDDEVLSMMPYSNQTQSSPGYQKDAKHKHINYKSKKHAKRENNRRSDSAPFMANFEFDIDLIPEMSPLSYVLVYLVDDNGELVDDYQEFSVNSCFKNEVEFEIPKGPLYPNDYITFNLKTTGNSVCAINLADRSTFSGWDNWVTEQQVFNKLKEHHFQLSRFYSAEDKYCQKVLLETQHGIEMNEHRKKRVASVYSSRYVDAMFAFKSSGLTLISDINLETRPCTWLQAPVDLPSKEATDVLWEQFYNVPETTTTDTSVAEDAFMPEERFGILDYFSETWLWKDLETRKNEKLLLKTKAPSPATEWIGNVFCSSETDGLGLLALPTISVFQPFSISYIMPYTGIAGEKIPISITIQSNIKKCLTIGLRVKVSSNSEKTPKEIKGPVSCLCKEEYITTNIYLNDLPIGVINVTVQGKSILPNNRRCSKKTVDSRYIGMIDSSSAFINMRPKGFLQEITHSEYVCPSEDHGGNYVNILSTELPKDTVPGSVKAEINMFGNMLWPGLSSLENIVNDPITNGEGNILSLAATIFVMDFLNAVGKVSYEIEMKAIEIMEKCYQQQMNYIHKDGSFSIFGSQDREGSELLTAFVLRILVKARSYIYVDEVQLQKSISWLRDQQLENGCFYDKLNYSLTFGLYEDRKNMERISTAFVIMALLEFGTPQHDLIIDKGLNCLRSHDYEDIYMLSLYAYVFTLYGHAEADKEKYQNVLERRSKVLGEETFWLNSEDSNSITSMDIEATSYALLSLLGTEATSKWQDLRPVIRWLTKQRKPMGGFMAAKDSVIAFQAISQYALMWSERQEPADITIYIDNEYDPTETFQLTNQNQFELFTYSKPFKNKIRIDAEGRGCGIIQTSLTYNVLNLKQEQSFHLRVSVENTYNNCAERKLKICSRYTGRSEKTNIVIMEVKMLTGWIPQQIVDPKHTEKVGVKKYEMTEDYVYLYFDEMNKTAKCIEIEIEQVLALSSLPAGVVVYDYYDRDVIGHTLYGVKTTCGTKEELPVVSQEEYENSMTQQRQPIALPPALQKLLKLKSKNVNHMNAAAETASSITENQQSESAIVPNDTQTINTANSTFNATSPRRKTVAEISITLKTTSVSFLTEYAEPIPVTTASSTNVSAETSKEPIVVNLSKNHKKKNCPVCWDNVPKDYHKLFCNAVEVYKISSGKNKEHLIRVMADLRPLKKLQIKKFVVPKMDKSCECACIKERGRRVLMRMKAGPKFKEMGPVRLDKHVVIFPLKSVVERHMRRLAKSCKR
ncbi:alpha-2-macroglobulin-like isoform X1 [Octopus vulgaris]|uniref:Alpha-2-macroglobulin-like isoform X1 n=1 Tax=Octopus vulgaris TaxID=6645 RepID=A0AA36B066_OCTVU|nr:alpha-2-macroglobulin-like isoform X1 [Octopus vulgaris]